MEITILGCGPSIGVPDITGDWGKCDPQNPKNRRSRSSLFIEWEGLNLLIDAGPDLNHQFSLIHGKRVDALLITHAHYDHIGGIGELRRLSQVQGNLIPIYMSQPTADEIFLRDHVFFDSSNSIYPPVLEPHIIAPYTSFEIHGRTIFPFPQQHGSITSLGFRLDNFAYSTDFKIIPEEALTHLEKLDLWIVECLKEEVVPHQTHPTLSETLSLIHRLKPKHSVLTHMGSDLDYDNLLQKLPPFVEPAYDGMTLKL